MCPAACPPLEPARLTHAPARRHNRRVSRTRFARTAAFVALLALVGGVLLPSEHVHYAPDGHHAAVVHRHFSVGQSSTAIHAADDDDHVQEVRDAWLAGRPFVFPLAATVSVRSWDEPLPLTGGESVVSAALRIDHGPPLLPRVLRGPPLSA
jgi:hypothetical protein